MKKDMTNGKEWKLILLFTLPIMAGSLLQQLYNTVDGIIVGNFVSEAAFASVGTCQPLVHFFLSFAMGLSIGVGIVISQYFGAGKHDKLPIAIDSALILLGACGLLLTTVSLVFTPYLLESVLGVPEEILQRSIAYFRIYTLGLFFQFVYNCIAAILRSFGDSKATLYFLIITAVLNTVLDLLFVVVFKWDVSGAATATVIAQVVCVIASYTYLRRRFPLVKSGSHWDREIAVTMTRLGLPIAIQQGVVAIGSGAMQRMVNGFGETVPGVIAAYSAGFRLDSFIFIPIFGFQSGLASFCGQNMGAGRLDRVKRGFYMTLVMSMSTTVLLCALLYIFAASVVTIFGLTNDSVAIGVQQVRFLTRFYWLFSGYITLGGLLQGAGDTVLQSVSTLSALIVRIATSYLAVGIGLLGYSAAWVTTPIGWTTAAIITYTRYFTGGWKKKAVAGRLASRGDGR